MDSTHGKLQTGPRRTALRLSLHFPSLSASRHLLFSLKILLCANDDDDHHHRQRSRPTPFARLLYIERGRAQRVTCLPTSRMLIISRDLDHSRSAYIKLRPTGLTLSVSQLSLDNATETSV